MLENSDAEKHNFNLIYSNQCQVDIALKYLQVISVTNIK